jgi:carbonic anhydrase
MTEAVVQPPVFRAAVGRDLFAGLAVFVVALPLCIGIAHASGAPLVAGLLAGVIGGVLVGALSKSQVSVAGPAAGIAALVLSQIRGLGGFEAFLMALVIAGAIQLAAGLFGGGALVHFVPSAVVRGLLAAFGLLLILKQLPHLVGHDRDFEGDEAFVQADGDNTFTALVTSYHEMLPGCTLVGLLSLAVLFGWERLPWRRWLPGSLLAVVVGTLASELLLATGSSWAITGRHLVQIPLVGQAGQGWGEVLHWPDLARLTDPAVYLAAGTLALLMSLESLLNLEITTKLDPRRRGSQPNRELVAQGIGNMVSGCLGGLPITSLVARSSININAGGRTRLATISHGLLLLLGTVALAGLLNRIPLAALAAVLIATGFRLADWRLFAQQWQQGWVQWVPFAVTILAILFTDLLSGVVAGLLVSLGFVFVRSLSGGLHLVQEEHVGGVVHRIELGDQLGFLHRGHLFSVLSRFRRGDQVAIDARKTDYIDPDLLAAIREFAREEAPARGVRVSLLGFQQGYDLADVVDYVDYSSREVQAALTPAKVLDILKAGNQRFCSGRRLHRDLVRQVDATATGQHPMAVVLSCIDSRAPVEILFDLGIGDMFSVRVAGNVARNKALGSMEFACKVAGAKLIVVLGHTRCGAVKATCDFEAKGMDPVAATGMTNLPAITGPIAEAVRAETETVAGRDSSNSAFVDRVARLHVLQTIRNIVRESPTLGMMLRSGEIGIIGGMYDIATGMVEFYGDDLTGGQVDQRVAASG